MTLLFMLSKKNFVEQLVLKVTNFNFNCVLFGVILKRKEKHISFAMFHTQPTQSR
jgi:hypothetical protein